MIVKKKGTINRGLACAEYQGVWLSTETRPVLKGTYSEDYLQAIQAS